MAAASGAGGLTPGDSDRLYDEAACGLLVARADGVIQRVNNTFCRWVGREQGEIVGHMRLSDLLTMGGKIFLQTHWVPLLQMQRSVAEVKLDVLHRDGHSIPMVLNAVAHQRQGVVVHEYAVFVAEDRHKYERELVLARKRAEELLLKEQAAQSALALAQGELETQRRLAEERAFFAEQMMAIVSHDLRNPLAVIRLSAHVIGLGELSSNQLRALGRLTTANARAARLIADLLDLSKARFGGGLQVNCTPLDLHDTVADSLDDLRAAYPGHPLVHETRGRGECEANADRLVQMIGNLVINALTYGAADRPIVVRSLGADESFTIEVMNEGPEIPADLRPRLFDPMTRGGGTPDATRSIGLGLFIVREIARAMGGSVAVESENGRTTFRATMGCRA